MSDPIRITIPHQLGKEEARRRIEQGFARLSQQLAPTPLSGIRQAWSNDRLSFTANAVGQQVTGRLDVSERDICIEVDLPPLLSGIANLVRGRLKQQGRLLLEKK